MTRKESNKRCVSKEAERLIAVQSAYCGQVILVTGINKTSNVDADNNNNNNANNNMMMNAHINTTHTVSDLSNSISNHFVLVSGDAVNALLNEAQFTNE